MKKMITLVVLGALGAGFAFAGSLNVPFFLDNAPSDGSFPPSTGTASFVAIHNNTDSAIVLSVTYRTDAGLQRTPTPNTFSLPANTTYSFRPVGNDSATEGPATAVPSMTQVTGDFAAGSATISWIGGTAQDVQGRLTAVRSTANGGDSFSFTLPPGF